MSDSIQPNPVPAIGIIGGSGLYEIDGFRETEEISVDTPYGSPSDLLIGGQLGGRQVYFLPRHGKGHTILPSELNHRANIWALRSLNVRWIICVTAVGSLQEDHQPRNIVLPDQFFDRTSQRRENTFFGGGIAAHISFAEPISAGLRQILADCGREENLTIHDGGTYVNMDGPAFSTRAESKTNHQLGFDVIGMTNLPEAKLAREAEIALATLAMITDYDSWKVSGETVTAHTVVEHLQENAANAKKIIAKAITRIPKDPNWPEHRALDDALFTDASLWPNETCEKLQPLLGRFLTPEG